MNAALFLTCVFTLRVSCAQSFANNKTSCRPLSTLTETITYGFSIGMWRVGAVTDMSLLFRNKFSFDEDLSGWNVSAATNMEA